MKDISPILQELYDLEINFSIQVVWDAGFFWKLGDSINGVKAKGNARTFDETCNCLLEAAKKHFPKSFQ